jgi:hypothetical protein
MKRATLQLQDGPLFMVPECALIVSGWWYREAFLGCHREASPSAP